MTGQRRRVQALEVAHAPRLRAAARAYLAGLTDEELDALHVAVLRRDGHPDPEGEAARVRAWVQGASAEDLRAVLHRLEEGEA